MPDQAHPGWHPPGTAAAQLAEMVGQFEDVLTRRTGQHEAGQIDQHRIQLAAGASSHGGVQALAELVDRQPALADRSLEQLADILTFRVGHPQRTGLNLAGHVPTVAPPGAAATAARQATRLSSR